MFKTEAELVEFFINYPSKRKKIYIKELITNFGIPDIIELLINSKIYSRRIQNLGVPIERIDTYILSFLYGKGWVKRQTITGFLNISKSILNKSVKRLLSRQLITLKGEYYIKLNRKDDILFINSIKVYEAKLSNWKYVIEQAERHLWFTNQSFILLPKLSADIVEKATSSSIKVGVGVVVADRKKVNYLSTPQKKSLKNTPLLWELNEGLLDGRYGFDGHI